MASEVKRILFSCLGTTDPVRGMHDGPMLHIVRHYRPDKIFWYFSKEIYKKSNEGNSFKLALNHFLQNHPDYHPEILPFYIGEQKDVSDFDAFYDDFLNQLNILHDNYPDAEIILNLSSGTPQMKTTLALLAFGLRLPLLPVQVKNFQQEAGTAARTTDRTYNLEEEIEKNEDDKPDAQNRTSEVGLFSIQKQRRKAQIESLLKHYDYEALCTLWEEDEENSLQNIGSLLQHLAARARYDTETAKGIAKTKKGKYPGLILYIANNKSLVSYQEYCAISEYVLVLKLMQRTKRYTDLVIRLNPLVIRLQQTWLQSMGVNFKELGIWNGKNWIIDPLVIEKYDPDLLEKLNKLYGKRPHKKGQQGSASTFVKKELSIDLANHLIKYYGTKQGIFEGTAGQDLGHRKKVFNILSNLNQQIRNQSAHTLHNVTEARIKEITGHGSEWLIIELIDIIAKLWPQHYDPALFDIFDTANNWILDRL